MLYDAPGVYDLLFAERRDDVRWYRAIARGAAEVLEFGCGTGRITVSLADDGCVVEAIDLAPAMLAELEERRLDQPAKVRERIRPHLGDARYFSLGRAVPRVFFAFNGLAHCETLDDLAALFENVRRHLTPDGLFAFDVWVPDPGILAGATSESGRLRHPLTGAPCTVEERFQYDSLRQVLKTEVTFRPVQGFGERESYTLSQRMFFPEETMLMLRHFGFSVRWRSSRWDPPDDLSRTTVEVSAPDEHGAMLAYVCSLA